MPFVAANPALNAARRAEDRRRESEAQARRFVQQRTIQAFEELNAESHSHRQAQRSESVPEACEDEGGLTSAEPEGEPRVKATQSKKTSYTSQTQVVANMNKPGGLSDQEWAIIVANAVEANQTEPVCPLDRQRWSIAIGILICINALLIGFDTDYNRADQPSRHKWVFDACEHFFCLVWTIETCVRLWYERKTYFCSVFNLIDFCLVGMCIITDWVAMAIVAFSQKPYQNNSAEVTTLAILRVVRILRIMRLLRLIKLMRMFKELWLIINGFIEGMRTLSWVLMMLFLVVYAGGIYMTTIIGHACDDDYKDWEQCEELFGTVYSSMYSLFQVMTFESWSMVIARPAMKQKGYLLLFFLGFLFLTSFGLLNIIVGVIVENTLSAANEQRRAQEERTAQKMRQELLDLQALFIEADEDGNGDVSLEEFKSILARKNVKQALQKLELPTNFPERLFEFMDQEERGSVSVEQFIEGALKLKEAPPSSDMRTAVMQIHQMHRAVGRLERMLISCMSEFGIHQLPKEKTHSFADLNRQESPFFSEPKLDESIRPRLPTRGSAESFDPCCAGHAEAAPKGHHRAEDAGEAYLRTSSLFSEVEATARRKSTKSTTMDPRLSIRSSAGDRHETRRSIGVSRITSLEQSVAACHQRLDSLQEAADTEMPSVAELKKRVTDLGLEIPPGVVEKSDLLAFVERAEAGEVAGANGTDSEPLSPGVGSSSTIYRGWTSGPKSVTALKCRLRELGFDVPANIRNKNDLAALVEEAEKQKMRSTASTTASTTASSFRPKTGARCPIPPPWIRKESRSRPGCFYFENMETEEKTWEPWFRQESRSKRGHFYYVNVETGETTWDPPTARLREKREEERRHAKPPVEPTVTLAAVPEDEDPPEPCKLDYRDDAFADGNPAAPSQDSIKRTVSNSSVRTTLSAAKGGGGVTSLRISAPVDDWEKTLAVGVAQTPEAAALPEQAAPDSPASPTISSTSSALVVGSQMTWMRGPLIGRGSLGRVFKAVNQATGQIIAVKEINVSPQDEQDAEFRATLENEVEIMKGLDHPRVVCYLGHDYIDSCLYLYLEFLPGGTLTHALNEFGAFEESLVQRYSKQLLEGLEYLHGREPALLHRDLKGSNILLGAECNVKLADFGCSKRTDQTMTHTMRGSIPWMAPEVIAHAHYGRAADMWSFGCVVVEMCTAMVPWGRFENQMAALVKIGLSQELPPMPAGRSEDCIDFILRCVNRDPSQRAMASELLQHVFVQSSQEAE